jgi:hypothetical protein
MKKTFITLTAIAAVLVTISSCKKAGTGGNATLAVFPKHHGTPIPNQPNYPDSIFVKFNTEELPSNPTTNYDALFVGASPEDHIHCEGLKTGKYYLYCTGWDTTINQRVTGGMAVKIKHKDRKDEIVVDIAVTED